LFSDSSELIWTLAGLAMLGISTYMVGTRIIMPRFGSPWVNRRQRESSVARGQALLARDDLDEETRYQLQSRLNALRARGANTESWGRSPSERNIQQEISEICDQFEERHPA
jgi:hypothetical protein